MDERPLILTLQLDEESQAWFDGQRRRYFPPSRNFLAAHLTLFHALPAALLDDVNGALREVAQRAGFPVAVSGVRSLGRGVAYTIDSPELKALRSTLVQRWAEHLTPQDAQPLAAHVTIQNKVDVAAARALYEELREAFVPRTALATGLALWRYAGGPWEPEATVAFGSADPQL
ncbi:MAG: 2'-5' RNA ligase family protein [Proteobacteria bacterium]|nr:MAG: 2'-5' RNA ligase family protein [Pseudomonadota bacterium]